MGVQEGEEWREKEGKRGEEGRVQECAGGKGVGRAEWEEGDDLERACV